MRQGPFHSGLRRAGIVCAGALLLSTVAPFAHAVPLISENFNYTAGLSLKTRTGGSGWSGAWAEPGGPDDTQTDVIAAGNLTFSNLLTGGNHLVTNGKFSYDDRTAGGAFGADGNFAWFSVELRRDVASNGANGPDYAGLVLGDENFPNSLFIGKPGGGDDTHYDVENGDGSNQHSSTIAESLGTVAFLVVKVTFNAGPDTVDLYVNPAPGAVPPASPDVTKSDLDLGQFSLISISTGAGATWSVDEIRVGTDFGDVAPTIPEPGAISMLLGLAPLLRRPQNIRAKATCS